MTRIDPVNPAAAPARSRPLLEAVQSSLGLTPNIVATIAHSPAALDGYLSFGRALGGGVLSGGLREQIALAVAGANACDYCASAHTALGKQHGVSEQDLETSLEGRSADPSVDAALGFARRLVETRGHVTDDDLQIVRNAGYDDGAITEIIANVALNIFTNYFNHVAGTEIDFPVVRTAHGQVAA